MTKHTLYGIGGIAQGLQNAGYLSNGYSNISAVAAVSDALPDVAEKCHAEAVLELRYRAGSPDPTGSLLHRSAAQPGKFRNPWCKSAGSVPAPHGPFPRFWAEQRSLRLRLHRGLPHRVRYLQGTLWVHPNSHRRRPPDLYDHHLLIPPGRRSSQKRHPTRQLVGCSWVIFSL